MAYQVLSATLGGIDAVPVFVQIDSSPGLHSFTIVGLGDKAVQESVDRIEAAIRQSGFIPPRAKNRRFIVNLAPADMKKEGSFFDLPIALAYLVESRQIPAPNQNMLVMGELGLDGQLAHTNGVLAASLLAVELGVDGMMVPACNTEEGAMVPGAKVYGADTLAGAIWHLVGTKSLNLAPTPCAKLASGTSQEDSFSFIRGQLAAKRALVVAAAGSHNMLMNGAPGAGKTLLARSLIGLLPPLDSRELIEVAKIRSAAGLLCGPVSSLGRPFCAPHHTSSPVAVIGGGTTVRPGQISLAHRGVLFLDEMPEFPRNVLEALRQPLEDGSVVVSRASGTLKLPAKFMLVGAMNPCPCGNLGDPKAVCTCTATAINRYAKRISGPLLDRMDIQVFVSREGISTHETSMTGFSQLRDTIAQARQQQRRRLEPFGMLTNSEISHKEIEALCVLEPSAEHMLQDAVHRKNLSLRAYHKIKKIGRTIADLEGADIIGEQHVAEAMSLRINDRVMPQQA